MENSDPSAQFDLIDFLPYLLNQAAEVLSLEFQRTYKGRYGMLRTEWRVLFHLGRYGPMTAKEICERAVLHKTKVSRAVAALEGKRFVTRQTDEDDRRRAELRLTGLGRAAFSDLFNEARAFNARVLAGMKDDEMRILRSCLVRIAGLDEK